MDHDANSASSLNQEHKFFYCTVFAAVRGLKYVGMKMWENLKVLVNCSPRLRVTSTASDCSDQPLSSNNVAMIGLGSHHGGTVSVQNQHSVSPSEWQALGRKGVRQYQHSIDPAGANNHLFALIIGIDKYQDAKIRNLKGCIKDSENVCNFLTESLRVNPLHIRHLRDEEATRAGILSTFEEHFIHNQEIQHSDAIVFYFAGHGSNEAPAAENSLVGDSMETICPYDDRVGARGIPDRTIASLLRRLASIKGNNITAIYDSCHSGGMGRIPDSDLENSRFLEPPGSPFPRGLDEGVWNTAASSVTEIQDPYLPYPPLSSHVLLAACQRDEVAYEASTGDHYSGAFTSLLLRLLREPERSLTETTYIGLFHALQRQENKSRLPKQTPYIEGNNKTRILFSMTDLGHQFPVSLSENGKFSVPAGTIHGVDGETEFRIISGNDCFKLKPFHVLPLSSSFVLGGMPLKVDSRANIIKWNLLHPKVFVQQSSDGPSDMLDYDVVISQSADGSMNLERRDELIPRYAESDIQFTPRDASLELSTADTHTSTIIDAVTRFNFYLLLQSKSNDIGDNLHVKLEHLSTSGGFCPVEGGKDFFTSGELLRPKANIKKEPKVTAAVKIVELNQLFGFTFSVDNYQKPLFLYVLGFDPSTYEIASFYHSEPSKEGPLRADRKVSIGYGNEGGYALKFHPNEVTFFKVFVTSKYVDLKGLVQESPFLKDAGRMPKRPPVIPPVNDFWESWIYVVHS
ncbi:hypothetical protein BYT27DRAFT_7230475 [Phlegmacium glaucopus]|nr:hypothetical protein BYT27DRAFT_7230475 [Phlegmacium glaucopus]